MDRRTYSFARRFKSALPHLDSASVKDIVSLKYLDHCVNNSEYSQLVDDLKNRDSGLLVDKLDGEFGGWAWLVTDSFRNRAILVEHETGLEILGAIGSVASLIALLPLISSAWTRLRGRFFHPRFNHSGYQGVEIRQFNRRNTLVEQQVPNVEIYVLNLILQDNSALKQKMTTLEAEIAQLNKALPSKRTTSSRRTPKRKK